MKPYLIVSGNFVKTGGMDRANLALAAYLADSGHETHLVGFSATEEIVKHPRIRFHPAPKLCNSVLMSEPLLDIIGRKWAASVIKAGGRVIVNGANCGVADINWVHYVHSAVPFSPRDTTYRTAKALLSHELFRWRERSLVPKSRLIIVPSQRTKQDVINKLAVSDKLVKVVPLGIDSQLFRPAHAEEVMEIRNRLRLPQHRLLACFIGAFDGSGKGFEVLFAAWKELYSRAAWDVVLLVIGDGPDRHRWERRAVENGLAEHMQFLGFRKDVPELLRACDTYILPSKSETYSLSTQEALCCGIPAFVTASAGIAERYPEELSMLLLSNPNNSSELIEKLQRWRHNPDYQKQLVLPFAKQLSEFTWDRMAGSILGLVETTNCTSI